MSDKDAPPPYGNVSPWMAKTTTTRVTTTTTETHFFPLFRRKPQVEGRDKALPLPPPEGGDRNITRARSRDVTPTPPVPTVIPATPIQQSNPRFPPRDIRRIRSSESVREQDSRPTTAPIPRGRQTAMSSPSLATRTLSPPQPARQTILYTGSSRASQGWEREQGRLTWEAPPPPMITRDGRRPSAPAITIPKGKGKEVEPSPVPVPDPVKRSILGRRPSFWRKNRPKVPEPAVQPDKRSLEVPKAGPSRSSTSFEEPTPPRQSTSRPSTASRPSVHRLNSRPSTDKLSALARSNNSRQNLSRQSTDSPRHSVESRRSIDLSLPNVRPASPLFTEFGTYRASVDFAAAGGPSLMAALAERGLAERGRGDESVIMEDEPEPRTEPVPIPETHTPPRRRLTNNSSVGRGASWRRSLVESARSFIGGSNHSVDEVGLFGDGISGSPVRGSPVQTASSSPVPWAASTSTSPRASPGRAGTMPLAAVVGPTSPPLAITTGSLRSRHGPPSVTSPTNTRVTFGDDPQRSRAGSITASIANWKSSDKDSNRGIRRARSTSRLTAAFTPSRKRSLSLFGQRPGSAGQVQTARERDKVQNSAPGHSHPSAFGPATEPALTLAPPVSYPFPSHPDTPVTNPATPLTGSQLSLGGGYTSSVGGSNVGHGSNTNVSGTPTAGASRTSSLLRSPLRPRSSTNPPLLRRLSGVFGSGSSVGMFSNRNGSEVGEFGGVAVVAKPAKAPARAEGDTPQVYLARLLESVSKSEVASAIASKNDAFHVAALGLYMERFNFVLDPLDIALRRLLMDLSLPKETQQIDRVMEAFAKRYADCNPGLFVTEDHAYVLAFSLMMLHTDAFNKSNKNKMTKADYVKNTRMPGVPPEILDCFFDNIVFAPFIFIEDATDVNGQRGFIETRGVTSPMPTNNSGTLLASKPRIDPYYMITQNLLDPLRVPIDQYIPPASPFSFTGTADNLDPVQLRRVFVSNTQLEIAGMGSEVVRIGVNKLGLLSRKDDLLEGGRRAGSRKWRRWAVVLTGSQLLFFREAAWSLLAPTSPGSQPSTEVSPQTSSLRPEEVIPLKDAVALYDVSYSKYPFVFRFILPSGRQQLIQAANEQDMNEWIARINYASALKSAGVRVRELAMNAEESRATGVAAAVSHARDQRRGKSATPPSVPSWSTEDLTLTDRPTPAKISEKLSNMSSEVELDAVVEPSDGGMKDTFDEVKAQLAATHNTLPRAGLAPPRQNGYRAMSLGGQRSSTSSPGASEEGLRSRMTTRAEVVTSKVRDLETKISTTQVLLQNELRIARNFAVLAPFQQTTRTRIRLAAESLARRIQVVRIDLAKMGCHRDVLAADLAAEEGEREQLRAIALEAAKEQLLLSVPRMTLSAPNDSVNEEPERRPSPAGSDASASPAWSMRSGTDYPEDPTLVANKRDTSLTTPETEAEQLSLSPPRKSEASLQPRPSFAASVSSRSGMSHMSSNCDTNGQSVEQANTSEAAVTEEETEEQAEIWHATRAGRRVSLVELPHPPEGRKLVELIRQRTHGSRVIGETTLNEPSS